MSEKKGMPRYSVELKAEIRTEHQDGKSVRNLSRKYGVSRYSIQSWCGLRLEVNLRQQTSLPRCRKPKTVLRVMNKYGLLCSVRKKRKYRQMEQHLHRYENILNRKFSTDRSDQKWVTDISYIHR